MSMLTEGAFFNFCQEAPCAVMAHAILQRTLSSDFLDGVFYEYSEHQYTRTLTFSSLVDLVGEVVIGTYSSINAAWHAHSNALGVSTTAVYYKLQGIEPAVSEGMVCESAEELIKIVDELKATNPEPIPGYQMIILDGNCIAATEHRLEETRDNTAAPLPGKSLCIYSVAYEMITHYVPCEFAYTQERLLTRQVWSLLQPNHLLVADRNFCFFDFLKNIKDKDAFFIIRLHSDLKLRSTGEKTVAGSISSGKVLEQPVATGTKKKPSMTLRRITIVLNTPTKHGETELVLVTNLPATVSALLIAAAYLRRWNIEVAFLDLKKSFKCELNTLCFPKASLFVFAVAVLAYNVQSVLKAAVRSVHGAEAEEEVSRFYMSSEVQAIQAGLNVAYKERDWHWVREMSHGDFIAFLRRLAKGMNLEKYKKAHRGEKKTPPKRVNDIHKPHVETATLLFVRQLKATEKQQAA